MTSATAGSWEDLPIETLSIDAKTVPADKGPWAVAVNPVTNIIYVANRLSDKVTVIDGRTNTAVQR